MGQGGEGLKVTHRTPVRLLVQVWCPHHVRNTKDGREKPNLTRDSQSGRGSKAASGTHRSGGKERWELSGLKTHMACVRWLKNVTLTHATVCMESCALNKALSNQLLNTIPAKLGTRLYTVLSSALRRRLFYTIHCSVWFPLQSRSADSSPLPSDLSFIVPAS